VISKGISDFKLLSRYSSATESGPPERPRITVSPGTIIEYRLTASLIFFSKSLLKLEADIT
jgi:hypothetical protein